MTIVTDWNSMEGAPESRDWTGKIRIRSQILGIDDHGNYVGIFAVNVPLESLTEEQWREVLLWQSSNIVDHEDQSDIGNQMVSLWIAVADNKSPTTSKTWIEQVPNK